jgi:hypothetical protein
MVFTVQPVGWVGDWHKNPARQWIVPLSGRWWVEAMDGTRARWDRANCLLEKIRAAGKPRMAAAGTAPALLATSPRF